MRLQFLYQDLKALNLYGWLRGSTDYSPNYGEVVSQYVEADRWIRPPESEVAEVRDKVEAWMARRPAESDVQAAVDEFRWYRRLETSSAPYEGLDSDLSELYALSRFSDFLLLSFQGRPDEPPPLPAISRQAYIDFWQTIGFESFQERRYSPFFHEIVDVIEADDPLSGVQIERELWPGLMLGDMLFSRAGVVVRAHSSVLLRDAGERSTLYFGWLRWRRRCSDLSHGWGHNSQWATRFRRDYVDDQHFHFNVDGEVDIAGSTPNFLRDFSEPPPTDLPIELRREHLVNRYLISQLDDQPEEQWPYDDRLVVRRDDPLVNP